MAKVPEPSRYLVRLAENERSHPRALFAETLHWAESDAPFEVHLAAWAALDRGDIIEGNREAAAVARRAVLARMLTERPEFVDLRLWAAIDGRAAEPLTDAELSAAEHALEGKDRSLSALDIDHAFERAYAQLDPAQAPEWLETTFLVYPVFPNALLSQRVSATARGASPEVPTGDDGCRKESAAATRYGASPEVLRRLAGIMEKAGHLLLERSTVIDRNMGASYLRTADRLSSNPKLVSEADAVRQEIASSPEPNMAIAMVTTLPIRGVRPAMDEAIFTDELASRRTLGK